MTRLLGSFSFAPSLSGLEGAGAARIGTVLLYILICSIGMRAMPSLTPYKRLPLRSSSSALARAAHRLISYLN
jgi:hypothetical protein